MRKPQITRTITTTIATILCVNPSTRGLTEEIAVLPRTYADNDAIMKFIEKNNVFAGEVKPVSVVSTKEEKKLYKMPEEMFVQYATPVDDEEAEELESEENTEE